MGPALVTAILAVILLPTASADSVTVMSETLPTARERTSAAWTGSYAYVFGGDGGEEFTDEILRYEPISGTIESMDATLPAGRAGTSAVWTGEYAYIFGGTGPGGCTRQILRYDAAADSIETMSASFPNTLHGTSAVWTGQHVYLFGGQCGVTYYDDIFRYDPVADELELLAEALPAARSYTAAVWDGSMAYIFGGADAAPLENDDIVRFDPEEEQAELLEEALPANRWGMTAVYDGTAAYVIGDDDADTRIFRFWTAEEQADTMAAAPADQRYRSSAVWTGTSAFVFGGNDGELTDEILRYDIVPDPPRTPAVTPGPGAGELEVEWTEPAANTFSAPITAYRVYRGSASGEETFLTETGNVTNFTDTGLSAGATYFYKVAAVNELGEGERSGSVSATTFSLPGAPTGLTAARGNQSASLTWTAPGENGGTSITNYRVYRGSMSGNLSLLAELGNVTSYSDTGLTNGQTYYYQVAAANVVGEGTRSGEASVTPAAVPGAPQGVGAARGNQTVSLSWTAPTDNGANITAYKLYRGTSSGGAAFVRNLTTNTSHTDTGLTNGQIYYYQLTAVNAVGEGGRSTEVSATPAAAPGAPVNSTAARGNQSVTLTWTAAATNGAGLTAHRVYRGTSSGSLSFLVELGNVTSHTDTGLTNGQAYYYQVSAVNAVGEGARSSEAAVTPADVPSPPQGPSGVRGNQTVSLAWSKPADNGAAITAYKLYRGTSPGGAVFLRNLTTDTTHSDSNLTNGQTYYYQLTAVNAVGEGPRSIEVAARPATLPDPPTNVTASRGSEPGEIELSWTPPLQDGGEPIVAYRIYRDDAFLTDLGTQTSYTDTGLPPNATRTYSLVARNAVGWGHLSSSATATSPAVPSAPLGFQTARGPSAGQVTLTWQAPADDGGLARTGYVAYHGPGGGPADELLARLPAGAASHVATGLDAGQARAYRVVAENALGEGSSTPSKNGQAPALPGAPGDLAATTGPAAGTITLNWTVPADTGGIPVTSYRVYRSATSGDATLLAATNATSYADGGLAEGAAFHYWVSSAHAVGEGPKAGDVLGKAPSRPTAPRNLAANPGSATNLPGRVILTWQAPADTGGVAVANYHIHRGTSSGGLAPLATVGAQLSFTDTTAGLTSVYYYEVAAANVAGTGPRSNTACTGASPWPAGFTPPVSDPCPAPPLFRERVLARGTIWTNATPPVQLPLVGVQGSPRADDPAVYDLHISAAGQAVATVPLLVGGLSPPPIGLELLQLGPQDLPVPGYRVEATLMERHDPAHTVCVVGGVCAPAATPSTWLTSGRGYAAVLVLEGRVYDPSGALVARQVVTVPILGQAMVTVP